eukprot:m.190051 g.190051  ORF g.190051 m.190051 type:complete len:205 (-) comp15637_c2_seq7:81-695(-)
MHLLKKGNCKLSILFNFCPYFFYSSYPNKPNCEECKKDFDRSTLLKNFGVCVCNQCRDLHYELKYSYITKTEAKEEYLLKEHHLTGPDGLKFVERKNTRNENWSTIKLYLLCQVEELSFKTYGGEDGLDAELLKLGEEKKKRKIAANEKKIKKLRKETLTANWMSKVLKKKHEHDMGDEEQISGTDMWQKKCKTCDYKVEFEKM